MKQIEIIVSVTGETRIETIGFTGAECLAASRFLERALGKASSDRLTAAYHQRAPVSQSQRLEHESS